MTDKFIIRRVRAKEPSYKSVMLWSDTFDMLKEIGASTKSTAILIPHSPGHLSSLTEQIRNAMMEADQVGAQHNGNGLRDHT